MNNAQKYKDMMNTFEASPALLGKVSQMKENKVYRKHGVARKFGTIAASLALAFGASNVVCYAATGQTWVEKAIIHVNGSDKEVDMEVSQDGDSYIGIAQVDDNIVYAISSDSKEGLSEASNETFEATANENGFGQLVTENNKIFFVKDSNKIDITADFADGESIVTLNENGIELQYIITGTTSNYSICVCE